MSEQLRPVVPDEPTGDQADQASRLQMIQEQEAIQAALRGDVEGTDAYEDRVDVGEPLEGSDPIDAESADASDDPIHGGGMPVEDPGEVMGAGSADEWVGSDLAAIDQPGAGAAVAVDEGGTGTDDPDASPFESDGDPDFAGEELTPVDSESAAEDLDALIDVMDLGHDPDDPADPDGYGVPPATDGGVAVIQEGRQRDPIAEE